MALNTMELLWIVLFLCLYIVLCAEKVTYISVEHPEITYYDKNFVSNAKLTSKRYGRRNPVYYVNLTFTIKAPLDNNVGVHFYFYEFLTNVYKRSFVEMHYNVCDFLEKDKFFGTAVKQNQCFQGPCPYPPGTFDMYNMTIPPAAIPASFPFRKGRIECNFTRFNKVVGSGHIDMEVKTLKKTEDTITFAKL